MNTKEHNQFWSFSHRKQLLNAFFDCPNKDELARLLRDLLTLEEIEEISLRLEVAKLLHTKVPYSQIQKATKFSTTTIARVSSWLKTGAGGYLRALKRMGL